MYRLRFQTISQLFDIPQDAAAVLPAEVLAKNLPDPRIQTLVSGRRVIAELPSVLWEGSLQNIRSTVETIKTAGVRDFLCENIGAVEICSEMDADIHGGMYLNVLNSASVSEYAKMGAEDLTLSFEMPLAKQRTLLSRVKDQGTKLGIVVYGYLPLMKFRACPAMGDSGCKGCTRDKYLTDRKGEKFRILCHDSQYSELLNCVPLYAADRSLPSFDFYTLYFTVETREECERIFYMVREKETPAFRRTAGLYNRELL